MIAAAAPAQAAARPRAAPADDAGTAPGQARFADLLDAAPATTATVPPVASRREPAERSADDAPPATDAASAVLAMLDLPQVSAPPAPAAPRLHAGAPGPAARGVPMPAGTTPVAVAAHTPGAAEAAPPAATPAAMPAPGADIAFPSAGAPRSQAAPAGVAGQEAATRSTAGPAASATATSATDPGATASARAEAATAAVAAAAPNLAATPPAAADVAAIAPAAGPDGAMAAPVAPAHDTTATARTQAPPPSGPLALPANPEAGFDDGFGERITWMAGQRLDHARIQLNPEHAGPIDVRVQVDGEQVRAEFQSSHAEVRQAIEASLPRLREMLGQHGLQLAQADVGHRDAKGERGGDAAPAREDGGQADDDAAAVAAPRPRRHALVDAYA